MTATGAATNCRSWSLTRSSAWRSSVLPRCFSMRRKLAPAASQDGEDRTPPPPGRKRPPLSVAREDKAHRNFTDPRTDHKNQERLHPRPQRLGRGRPRHSRRRRHLVWEDLQGGVDLVDQGQQRRPVRTLVSETAGDDDLVLPTVPWTVRRIILPSSYSAYRTLREPLAGPISQEPSPRSGARFAQTSQNLAVEPKIATLPPVSRTKNLAHAIQPSQLSSPSLAPLLALP